MAPSYKALAIPAQAIPQTLFGATQTPDLGAIMQQQALQRAQELATQQNEINTDQLQQKADENNAITTELKSRFGDGQDFNPDDALKVAQQVAISNGDINTALNIDKITKSRLTDKVLSPEEVQRYRDMGLDIPDDATMGDVRVGISLRNALTSQDKLKGLTDRFNTTMDWRHSKEEAPGVMDNLTDENGQRIPVSEQQKTKLSGIQSGTDQILRNVDDLSSAIESNRFPIGDEAVMQRAFAANIYPALRQLDNQGVRFNEFIKDLDHAQMGDEGLVWDRVKGFFTGQDPAGAMRRFGAEVARQAQAAANAHNGFFSPQKAMKFDPESFQLYSKYGLFDRGQPSSNNPDDIAAQYGTTSSVDNSASTGQDLSAYTPAQIQYMRSKGMIR